MKMNRDVVKVVVAAALTAAVVALGSSVGCENKPAEQPKAPAKPPEKK